MEKFRYKTYGSEGTSHLRRSSYPAYEAGREEYEANPNDAVCEYLAM